MRRALDKDFLVSRQMHPASSPHTPVSEAEIISLDIRGSVFDPLRPPPATRDHWKLLGGPKNQSGQGLGSGDSVPAALGHHLCWPQPGFSSLAPARGSSGGRFSDMLGAYGVRFGDRRNFSQRWTPRRAPSRPRTRFYGRSGKVIPGTLRHSTSQDASRQSPTPSRAPPGPLRPLGGQR